MFVTKSLTLHLFRRYDIASNHRMCSYLWVLTYGYLIAQVLKLNDYIIISKSEQTSFEFVYDLLNMLAYSVCLFYLCGLNNPYNNEYYMDVVAKNALLLGYKVGYINVSNYKNFGTPNALKSYE